MTKNLKQEAPLLPPGPPSDAATLVHSRPRSTDSDNATVKRRSRWQHRQTRRVSVCLGVGFESESSVFTGITANLSEGGVFVATHSLPPVGSEVALRFSLPSGPELRTRGIVRWQRDFHDADSAPPGFGVEFSALAERDVTLIRAFVDQTEPAFLEG